MKIPDYLTALSLIDPKPFDDTCKTLCFAENVRRMQQDGISLSELNYLLRHRYLPSSQIGPDNEGFTAFLKELRNALQGTAKPNDFNATAGETGEDMLRQEQQQVIIQKLAEKFQLEVKAADAFVREWLFIKKEDGSNLVPLDLFLDPDFISKPDIEPTAEIFPYHFKLMVLLQKVAFICARLKLNPKQLAWIFEYGPVNGWINFNFLPTDNRMPPLSFEVWKRLMALVRLRDTPPFGESIIDEILELSRETDADENPIVEKVANYTGWDALQIQQIAGPDGLNLNLPGDFTGGTNLLRIFDCLNLLKRLGISAAQACNLSKKEIITPSDSRAVICAVRAKYDHAQWLKVAKPLRDVIRNKQRSALVDYLVSRPNPKLGQNWQDPKDLFAYFLIDVEMSPCMMTSRIKQAINSVQLFVQRCLMNLEPDVQADDEYDDAWIWWQWMKNYRVWEANRKVFVYPENWIEPELRDDKSPFFKELESELLQSDVTMETAEAALGRYLEKLDQVARLQIVGICSQRGHKDILHVFGRTYTSPHVYYYRNLVDARYWTAWERIDLEIQGDHLIPVLWSNRLFLFWPIFIEKVETNEADSKDLDYSKYWEIKLAWSEYKEKKWSDIKISKNAISAPFIGKILNEEFLDDPPPLCWRKT